jgi:ATP-dependent DNA helicase RecQ
VVARKILSCVARVAQRFGAGYVTNVLRGQKVETVTSRGHHGLSTFGLLAEASVAEVRGYIEQLTSYGLLRQTDDGYPVLKLTAAGLGLLKDEASQPGLTLARQRRAEKGRSPRRGVEAESWEGVDRELFERLRGVRFEIARARNVPPYVIFHDTTLREMARVKPTDVAQLRGIYGVGERKAAELGERFVEAIRAAGV